MADEQYTFTQARSRLEEIVTQVRRKDVSLEKSLDLLEEGVRLANSCTELIDHTEWRTVVAEQAISTDGGEPIGAEAPVGETATGAEGSAEEASEHVSASEDDSDATDAADESGAADALDAEAQGAPDVIDVSTFESFADVDDAWPDEEAESPSTEPDPA